MMIWSCCMTGRRLCGAEAFLRFLKQFETIRELFGGSLFCLLFWVLWVLFRFTAGLFGLNRRFWLPRGGCPAHLLRKWDRREGRSADLPPPPIRLAGKLLSTRPAALQAKRGHPHDRHRQNNTAVKRIKLQKSKNNTKPCRCKQNKKKKSRPQGNTPRQSGFVRYDSKTLIQLFLYKGRTHSGAPCRYVRFNVS